MNKRMTNEQLTHIDELVENYKQMIEVYPRSNILRDARIHHTSMAAGGDEGPIGYDDESTIRGYYYSNYPDVFFQRICERMRWEW